MFFSSRMSKSTEKILENTTYSWYLSSHQMVEECIMLVLPYFFESCCSVQQLLSWIMTLCYTFNNYDSLGPCQPWAGVLGWMLLPWKKVPGIAPSQPGSYKNSHLHNHFQYGSDSQEITWKEQQTGSWTKPYVGQDENCHALVDQHLEFSVHKVRAFFDKDANTNLSCHIFQHQRSNHLVSQMIFASLWFCHHYVMFKEINKHHNPVFNSSQTIGIYQQGNRLWMWQAVCDANQQLDRHYIWEEMFLTDN